MEQPGSSPRASRGLVAGLVAASVACFAAGAGITALWLPPVFRSLLPEPAPPAVTALQASAVDDLLAERGELNAQLESAADRYLDDLSDWRSAQSQTALWAATDRTPELGAPNPGGEAMPGDDPTGRAFLDSIGATEVRVAFDAGAGNCGYSAVESDPPWSLAVGGCYSTAYRNVLFIAWDPGAESVVWPIFVHEAMHWVQADRDYDLNIAVVAAGADPEQWRIALEEDASCRAVHEHGIPLESYDGTSSPCTLGEAWHDGWLRQRAAELGALVAEPDPESYEVLPEARP